MASKVYYMNDRASGLRESTPFKALKLCRDIGIEEMIKPGDKVCIKTHMGEYGNSLNLRPHWVSVIVDEVKRLGGFPTVMDCNTVPTGNYSGRANATEHLKVASSHGFNEETLGCPVVIADGEYGFEEVEVEVPHGVFLKKTWMGKKYTEFDKFIVISHFKGHSQGVYGGALKNMGIGMGSKHGKIATHFYAHPERGLGTLHQDKIKACATAASVARLPTGNVLVPAKEGESTILDQWMACCPRGCFHMEDGEMKWDKTNCNKCMLCFCTIGQMSGIMTMDPSLPALWPTLIADAATGYVNACGKDNFLYINYCFDVTPICDCAQFHDRPMIPNLGVFVSKDPVAVDMACLEACEAAQVVPGSKAEEFGFSDPNTDRFTNCSTANKVSQWTQINSAVYNGLGSSEYELIESVPGPETDYWLKPYTPDNTWYMVHAKEFGKIDFDFGKFYHDEQKVPNEVLFKRPKGMIGDIIPIDKVETL